MFLYPGYDSTVRHQKYDISDTDECFILLADAILNN